MTAGPHEVTEGSYAMTTGLHPVRGSARSLLCFRCGMTCPMSVLRGILLLIGICLFGCQRLGALPSSRTVGVSSPPESVSDRLDKLPSALVYVRSYCKAGSPLSGTAFVVGHFDGWAYLVSARHVLFPKECNRQLAERVQLRGEGVRDFDGEASGLIELQTDSQDDLILLRTRGSQRTAPVQLEVLNTDMLGNEAEPIGALGFSMQQGRGALPPYESSKGSLTANTRVGKLALTTTAKLHPSMSGGPVVLNRSGLVVGVVLGNYELGPGERSEGRIASLSRLIDKLPEALRQQLGIVLHHPVNPDFAPGLPESTWVVRPEQKDALALLDEVKPGQKPARVLLYGIGGVGKTTLAYQLAEARKDRFPGGAIKVELTNKQPETILSDLLAALTGKRPTQAGPWAEMVRAQLVQRPPMLVILDNVRLDEEPWSQLQTMDALLQTLGPATLIMTSRSRQGPTGFTPIPIQSLPSKEATELALKLAQSKRVTMSPAQATELGTQLGGLPFALERAVELMQHENHSPESLLAKFRQDGRDPAKRLADILEWSYQALDAEAKAVLIAMGQLAEAPVPEVLLDGLLPKLDKSQRAKGINRLLRSGLMDRTSPGATTYHQHTLLWEWGRKLGTERHAAEAEAIQKRKTESLKAHDAQMAPLLIEHLLTAQRLAEQRQQWDRVLDLMWETDEALDTFGYWSARKEMLQRGLAVARQRSDRELLCRILGNLGNVARMQRELEMASNLYQESLAFAAATRDLQFLVANLVNLGEVARIQGDYSAATKFYRQSLAFSRSMADRKVSATILMDLGLIAEAQGDHAAALKHFQDALNHAQELKDRKLTASVHVNMGNLAASRDDDVGARRHYLDALHLAEDMGDRHLVAASLADLGRLAQDQGDDVAARNLYNKSLQLAADLRDRKLLAVVLMNLGELAEREDSGDLNVAERYFEESRKLAASLSVHNPILGRSLVSLASVAFRRGKLDEARQFLELAIEIFQRLRDPALVQAQQFRDALGSAPESGR